MTARLSAVLRDERGTALVLNLFALALFVSLAAIVYAGARSQVKTAVWVERQAQAQALAEAGLEDAMHNLYVNATWRTGFNQKALGDGYYTVTLTTGTPTRITSTGYSASMFLVGRAVRSVGATATYTTGNCPYAVIGNSISLDGKVDAYDPISYLTPCTTCFTAGANIWSNGGINVSGGASCPPTRIRGVAYNGGGGSYSGQTACAESGVINSTTSVALPNLTAGSSLGQLQISANSTFTLTAGNYTYSNIKFQGSNGVLLADTSSGTVTLQFTGNLQTGTNCMFNNTSKIPSRFHIVDVSGNSGHQSTLDCAGPIYGYIEGNVNRFNVAQEVYGHVCGGTVNITSTTGHIGLIHYDLGGGMVSHVSAGSWQEGFTRQ